MLCAVVHALRDLLSLCTHTLHVFPDVMSALASPAVQVAGTSGKVHIDGDSDDEGASTEAHGAAITEALGWQRRNEVMCLLRNMHGPLFP